MKKLIIVTLLIMVASCATVKTKQPSPRREGQDHLILATLWYQKSAEMRALFYQCFRNAQIALA